MKEWKKVKLGDISKTNLNQYSLKEDWIGIEYLDTGNITNNAITALQYIPNNNSLPSRARRKVEKLDIVYSTVRPNQKHFGIIEKPTRNMLVSTGFCVIHCLEGESDPYFIYHYLSQDKIVNFLHAIAEQSVSAYPSIRAIDIENMELLIPDYNEQVKIGKFFKSLDDKIALNKRINDNLFFIFVLFIIEITEKQLIIKKQSTKKTINERPILKREPAYSIAS